MMRMRSLFIVLFCVVSIVPVTVFWAWPHSIALQSQIDEVEERHLLIARNLGAALSRYQNDVVSVFNLISVNLINNVPITHYDGILDSLKLRRICIFILSTGQLAREASHEAMRCSNQLPEAKRLLFDSLKDSDDAQFTEVAEGKTGSPVMFVVKRYQNHLAVGTLSTEYFIELGKSVAFGVKGHAAIVDHAGNVLAHPLDSWIAARRNISRASAVQRMRRGETGVEMFYSPALKDNMIAGFTSVPKVNWGVMVPQPISELEDKANSINGVAMSVVIAGTLLAALVAWLASILLCRPLEKLTLAAKRVVNGDLNSDIDIGNPGMLPREVNEAHSALTQMALALRRKNLPKQA